MDNFPIQLSESILLHALMRQDFSLLRSELYFISEDKLDDYLDTDQLKYVFWVNIYNAYSLILANEGTVSAATCTLKRIKVAHNSFSLDDVESKIICINSCNPVYKFVVDLFCSSYIRKLAVKAVDYRC